MTKQPSPAPPQGVSAPSSDVAALPERVRAMRALLRAAARSGDIDELRPVIERNETMPIFASGPARPRTFADAIDFLKARSFDGAGRETLALIEAILVQPYARVTRGPVVTYVWPAFALAPPAAPSEETRAQMWRCVRFAAFAAAPDAAPPIERIGIGADGTWHFFWSGA
jgi:hypothetical protein